jgi:predicted TIM-barrel fold metal-dependent hydrolase
VLIDMHSHYLPRALRGALERRPTAPRIIDREGTPFVEYGPGSAVPLTPAFHDPEVILARMADSGFDHSVLSVTIPGVDWLDEAEGEAVADQCNEETAALVARYPRHFSGLATVPLQAPERAVTVLKRAVEMGLKGAMIYSNVAGDHLDRPDRRQFFDAAAELDVPVMLHPTYPICAPTMRSNGLIEIAGFLVDTTTAALRLVFDGLYERHPDFKFVVPHAGSLIPYFAGRIDYFGGARSGSIGQIQGLASDHLRKFYVDTVCNWAPAVRFCKDFFGVERIMLGSDHPFWPMALARKTLDESELTLAERAMIEHENAERVFRLRVPAAETH